MAINNALLNNRVKILEWFDKSKYEFKYSKWSLDSARKRNYIDVIEWFEKSKYGAQK